MTGSAHHDAAARGDLAALRDLAASLAAGAADLLRGSVGATLDVDTKSSPTDMVTEMDRASEKFLVEAITAARPDDGIVGEEGTDRPGTTGVRWVIDPLDGTTNYLYGLPGWNVSVGIEIDGVPAVGAVAVGTPAELYSAAVGLGARRHAPDDAVLTLGPAASLATTLVGTGFNYDPVVRRTQAAALTLVAPRVRDIRRSGAAANDLCWVAAGRLDAYYEIGLAPWDHCAGSVIAREAGARVEVLADPASTPDASSTGDAPTLTVAAHPDRWDEVMELLVAAGVR